MTFELGEWRVGDRTAFLKSSRTLIPVPAWVVDTATNST